MSKWQLLWWQCSHAGRDFEGCHCCISHIYHEDSIRYQSHHSPDGKVTISSYSDIFLDGLFRQRILSPAWNMEPSTFTLFLLRVSKQWAKFEGRSSMEFPCFALGHSGAKKEIRALHLMPDGEVSQGHDLDPAHAHFKQEPGLDHPPDFIFLHLCTVMYCPFCTSYYS